MWVDNVATFTCNNPTTIDFILLHYTNEDLFNTIVPCKYFHRNDEWGVYDEIKIINEGYKIDGNNITLKFDTIDSPPIPWYMRACLNYENILHINASYIITDGEYETCGAWSDTEIIEPNISIKYDGKYPNLCGGKLVVNVDGEEYDNFRISSGGEVKRSKNGAYSTIVGPWKIIFPHSFSWNLYLRKKIIDLINSQIPFGCCGGCM